MNDAVGSGEAASPGIKKATADETTTGNVTRDESIVSEYLAGSTISALSKQHRVTRQRIKQILRELGACPKLPESLVPEAMKPLSARVSSTRPLTPRQTEILNFLISFEAQHGFSAAYRDICERFGIKSTNAVTDHLDALERKGCIKRSGTGQARSIHILGNRPSGEARPGTIVVERSMIVSALRSLESIQDWIPNGVNERFQFTVGLLRDAITKDLPDYEADRAARQADSKAFLP